MAGKDGVNALFDLDGTLTDPGEGFVYGSELDGTRSGKTELLAYVCEKEKISGGVMIGDRAQDVAGALANGLTPVGALWGYGSREELEKAGAVHLCPHPSQLGSVPGLSRV